MCTYADEDYLVTGDRGGRNEVLQKASWGGVQGTNGGDGRDRHRGPSSMQLKGRYRV